jgi:hypothetical protein
MAPEKAAVFSGKLPNGISTLLIEEEAGSILNELLPIAVAHPRPRGVPLSWGSWLPGSIFDVDVTTRSACPIH